MVPVRAHGYHLVHIVTGGEFAKPLVASQVFDQAQTQAELLGDDAPTSVSVWLIEPFRRVLQTRFVRTLRNLERRAPAVKVRTVLGSSRLNDWPAGSMIRAFRSSLGGLPVVYHCRGESAAVWALKYRQQDGPDAVILDVRGAWPLEAIFARGHKTLEGAPVDALKVYDDALNRIRRLGLLVDGATTVSGPLRDWLVDVARLPSSTIVVPCCVKSVVGDHARARIRQSWGMSDKTILLYSGTVAAYQGLRELVLPFVSAGMNWSQSVAAVFLTPDADAMRTLTSDLNVDQSRLRIISLPQEEVPEAQTAGDLGLLLREPTPLNRYSQPTKLAEYLASGLPVAVESGTGEVPMIVCRAGAGRQVNIHDSTQEEIRLQVEGTIGWSKEAGVTARSSARNLANREMTWRVHMPSQRRLYVEALKRRFAVQEEVIR